MRGRTYLPAPGRLGRAVPPAAPVTPTGAAPGAQVSYQLRPGPFQNNGATQWFAEIGLGQPGQRLKIALDTGSNFVWVTSTLCSPTSCQHYGGGRFDYAASNTFEWVDQTPKTVDFGPWGSMTVETGSDVIGLNDARTLRNNMYLSSDYTGAQFAELDWDGGIGFPSASAFADPHIGFFLANLMDAGLVDPAMPYVSFWTDRPSSSGEVILGGVDENKFDPENGLFLPWSVYSVLPGVEYIWTTPLRSYSMGGKTWTNKWFALDSGSSQFKGDDDIMGASFLLAERSQPPVVLEAGTTVEGQPATITVSPEMYMMEIQAGEGKGKVIPQFKPLGIKDLALVGSLVMDFAYTIFEYDVSLVNGRHVLYPRGMWMFEKMDIHILKAHAKTKKKFDPKPVHRG